MHKSVIIGLLLLTAGLFGIATLNNIISHAMGQEYDNYYGDSSYSTYQTDDKKYECRTGPFEGFFVNSVEFCKFNKFDDRKDIDRKDSRDNRTGTQGPPGETGATGLQGPPGPKDDTGATGARGPQGIQGERGEQGEQGEPGTPGPNQILPANLYYNPGNEVSILGSITGTPGNSTATCQPGDIAIGGNFDVISYNVPLVGEGLANVVILYDGNEGFDKYSTDVVLFGISNPLTFTTNVLCFNNP